MTRVAQWTAGELAAYVARAEVRALDAFAELARFPLEAGDPAALCPAVRAYAVISRHDPDVEYRVIAFLPDRPGSTVHVRCDCPSGQYRDGLAVPCWHAAAVAVTLEDRQLAVRTPAGWTTPGRPRCSSCGAEIPAGALDYDHAPTCPDYVADPFDL